MPEYPKIPIYFCGSLLNEKNRAGRKGKKEMVRPAGFEPAIFSSGG